MRIFIQAPYKAHPRSRGEHMERDVRRRIQQGSSPLTRGALLPSMAETRIVGLIPAHAGSTDILGKDLR